MNSVWEDGEKEAGKIILGLKKKKKGPTIYRSFLIQSVIKLPKRKPTGEAGQWAPGPSSQGWVRRVGNCPSPQGYKGS